MSWLSDDVLLRLRAAAREPDLTGTRYPLLREIGRGGMSTVFLVEDPALQREVALKVLDIPDETGELAARLTREAQILARLEHPGIAPVHEVGQLCDGRVYYTMKFVAGPRLDEYVAAEPSLPRRLRLFQQIVDAVAFAHDRGVVHRDLKPENIMVGSFGEVLVMDWGLAKLLGNSPGPSASRTESSLERMSPAATTQHGTRLGTPGYMAPEQARGDHRRVDARADVYSLGAVLEQLIRGPRPRRAAPLQAVVAKAMALEPGERYPDALALGDEIARYLEGSRVEAHRERPFDKLMRLYRRHRVAFWLVAAYLVVRGALLFSTGR